MGLLVDFDNDHPTGGERMERSLGIKCPNLGFHVILDIRETSSVGQIHSCILDKGEGTVQNKLPQFRILQGYKPIDRMKMVSTSSAKPNDGNEYGLFERDLLRHAMRRYALIGYPSKDGFLRVTLWEMTPSILKIS